MMSYSRCSGAQKISNLQFISIYSSSSCCTHLKFKFHVGLLNGPTREAVVRSSCLAVVIYMDISGISPPQKRLLWIAGKQNNQGFWKIQLRRFQWKHQWKQLRDFKDDSNQVNDSTSLTWEMRKCFPYQCTSASWTPGVFVRFCYQERDNDDENYDDVAVLLEHVFNALYIHVFVFIKILSSNTAPDSQQPVLKLKGANA